MEERMTDRAANPQAVPDRTLFIGLGGTGGNTLDYLYRKMTDEEKDNSHYLFIDTDKKDTDKMRAQGITTVRISNADNVLSIINSLEQTSPNSCKEWIPFNKDKDISFLDSPVEAGAAQIRYKSRLCLTRFLRNPNNELQQKLAMLNTPGAGIEGAKLNVIIVSSIAGGTGAGTYIETALYVRKYFRDHEQDISIIGILACPEVFFSEITNENGPIEIQKKKMNANAYASIRELNAMNIATNSNAQQEDYGSQIKIKIGAVDSNGSLFDSESDEFTLNSKSRPFDSIYFVDKANSQGAEFLSINQYYQLMADIAYARLYSPLKKTIEAGEINEEDAHTFSPTAIYGSAGYARIIYPYEDVLRYIAEKRLYDDLDHRWKSFDDAWRSHCATMEDNAAELGTVWDPKPNERGQRFMEKLISELNKDVSNYKFLGEMVRTGPSNYRSDEFVRKLDSATRPAQFSKEKNTTGGTFGLLNDTDVNEAVARMIGITKVNAQKQGAIGALESMANNTSNAWDNLVKAVKEAIPGQALIVANAIMPTTEVSAKDAESSKTGINLKRDLLMHDGSFVHPIAARFLLYSMQKKIEDTLSKAAKSEDGDFETQMSAVRKMVDLTFDDNKKDENDITVKAKIESLKKQRGRKDRGTEALNLYKTKLLQAMNVCLAQGSVALRMKVYEMIKPRLNELIRQYERFFEHIGDYSRTLDAKIHNDRYKNDSGSNQIVYVGASAEEKDLCYADMKAQLERASKDTHSAAGEAVFEQLNTRAVAELKRARQAAALGRALETDDADPFDMNEVFGGIIKSYMDSLRRNAQHLGKDVASALTDEICHKLKIDDPKKINKNGALRAKFRNEFRARLTDLRAKASPMIRYNIADRQQVLNGTTPLERDVHVNYMHLGISKNIEDKLAELFPTEGDADRLSEFKKSMQAPKIDVNDEYGEDEIFCFSSVHCLRPMQIRRFNEETEDGYYVSYAERIREVIKTGAESLSPHLDKHWHYKGVMPFLSKELEFKWRKKIMSAFINEIVTQNLTFTIDANSRRCFKHNLNGKEEFVHTSAGELILERDISRLIDYIADNERLVDKASQTLDMLIASRIDFNSNYFGNPAKYKGGMTKDILLRRLREDGITYKGVSTPKMTKKEQELAAKIGKISFSSWESKSDPMNGGNAPDDDDDETEDSGIFNYNATLGSILKIAYRLHYSEERLKEDRNYGEALIAAAWDVVDKYARAMHGDEHVTGNTQFHKEYVEVLNHGLAKFLESYVKQAMFENRITGDEADTNTADDPYGGLLPVSKTAKRSRISVPAAIENSPEYIWISEHWKFVEE